MTNRLLRFPWAAPAISVLCLFIFSVSGLQAQFQFGPPVPNTYGTGDDCASSIAEANVTPTVNSTIGANIIISQFNPALSGYQATDLWPAPYLNLIVWWHVEDDQGNSANFNFTVNFIDQTPPEMQNLPNPADVYASVLQVPPPPNVTITDNCLGPFDLDYVQTNPPDTCDAGVFTRTWTATDLAGNTAVFTQTITILADNAPPTITVFPQNGSSPCDQVATAYPAWLAQQMANFTATDPSGIKSYSNNASMPFPSGCILPVTVTFSATDNCNKTKTTTAVFNTADTQGPAVTVAPKDTVAYCDPSSSHITKLGQWINQRAYFQATDACSSNSDFTYYMEVNGVQRDSAGVVADFLASFADGCGTKQIGSQTYNKVRGLVKVDFFVKDICNNTTFAGQAAFGAIDTLKPVITGANTTEQCGGANDQANLQNWINAHGNASVTDECSATTWTNFSFTTSNGQNGNGNFNAGPYPTVQPFNCNWWADVTFRATDDCGNIGSKTLRFQIQDTAKPVIAGFPPSVTLSCPNPIPTLSPSFVTDNCDTSMVISYTFTTSDTLCPGSYTMNVTWSATDDCGNTGTATQTVLVRDTEGPVFTLVPTNKTFRCDTFALPPFPVMGIGVAATDNCSQAMSIVAQDVSGQNPDPADCGHYTYDIVRTFTATDACGNTRTATQVISVIDNLGPAPGGLLDTTMVCEAMPFVTPPPSPVDACSGPTEMPTFVNDVVTNGPCDDTYTVTRNWQAVDVCGNTSVIPQIIHVVDTVRPVLANIPADVTVECDAIPAPPNVSSFNAADNCDTSVTVILIESEIRNPDTTACDHWTNYIIRREWTATDNCGNARTYTQHISVQDNTGPVLAPVPVVSLPAEQNLCGATVGIPAPISLYDVCTSLKNSVVLRDTALLVNTSGGPNNTTPVDTVVLQWPSPNIPPDVPALAPVTLKIYLEIADAESPTEFFRVYGEGNYLIGQTIPNDNPPTQCGNGVTTLSIPANELNEWLTDGQLTLTLAPNGAGSDAINALATCAGGRVRAELSYEIANPQVPISLTFSLDGDTAQVFPPSGGFFLDVGTHSVVYAATDCAGNSTTAVTTIEVQDLQPPVIAPPPADTFLVGQNNCEAIVALPFPAISDNCDLSGHLVQASASLPVIFENDPNAGWIPKDITLTMSGLIPNAISPGLLGIRHKGDNDNAPGGEFFKVFDENNSFLSITSSGATAEQCSLFHESVLNIPANVINGWAAGDLTTSFKLEANDDAGNFTDFIDTCAALLPDFTDGISRVQAVLEYSYAVVTYEIRNSTNQLVSFGSLIGNQTTDTLPPGFYTVKYLTTDINGLEGMATFQITVRDTVKPKAMCKPLIIFVNPSGTQTYTLQPSEINNGSTDNCPGALTYQLSQTTFNCSQAGNNYNVTLTVTDASGNSSACSALVGVTTLPPAPSYPGVCEGGNLQLFTNPPPGNFTYQWSGPNGYVSLVKDPIISPAQLSNEGTYCVTITGITGCTATGCVTVDLANLPVQPAISANGVTFCAGENIVLATPTYAGQVVTYQWYQDASPNPPVLLGTTSQPIFTITAPPAGVYSYFVKVLADGCASVNSNLLTVTVFALPPAAVAPTLIDICECQPLTLNSTTPPLPGLTYMWMGPGGFGSSQQSPLVTNCAVPAIHAGVYTLITKQNGCSSLPATVNVTVRSKPATPLLTGATQVCEGSTVTLICSNEPNAFAYEWLSPTLDTVTTSINSLVLTNVMVADSGSWRVRILKQGCYSDWSLPILVEVQEYPNVTADANTPLCQGTILQLSATSDIPLPSNNWSWLGSDGWTIFQQNPTRNPAVAGLYRVIGKTSFGCADTAFVNVLVAIPPEIKSVSHVAPICADGSDAVLQAVISSANPPLTYSWTGPLGFSSSDPMPVIPGITAAQSGTYNLVVTDNFGCSSAVGSTTINVKALPATPILAVTPPVVCAGADVTISISDPSVYTNPIYTWYTPNGDSVTTLSFIIIPNAQVQDGGGYQVIVAMNGCVSDTSSPVNLTVNPVPPTPTVTANTPLCEGQTLFLSTPLIFGATYQWSGPAGTVFIPSANVRNPIVQNVTTANSGNYSVTVTLNGCSSSGEGKTVVVKPRPKKPELFQPQAVCFEQTGAVLILQITPQSAEPGAEFIWFYDVTDDTIGGPGFSLSLQISDFNGFTAGQNGFYVIANEDGCNSLPSEVKFAQFDTIPDGAPFAGMDGEACSSAPLTLKAANPAPSTGQWAQITALPGVIVNPNEDSTLVTGIVPDTTYLFAWMLSYGGCVNYASDTVSITTFAPEQSLVEEEIKIVCYADSVQLNAVQGQTTDGYWTQDLGQQLLGLSFADSTDPYTVVNGLIPGNTYYFFWNLDNGACGISSKRVTVIDYGANPSGSIADQVLCKNDSCTTLLAPTLPAGETGLWYSDDPSLVFSTPASNETSVCNLKRGSNKVIWRTNGGFCGPQSFDTVLIVYDLYPTAVPDSFEVDFGTTENINVLLNDFLPQQYSVTVEQEPMHGALTPTGIGQFTYRPDVTFSGVDQMVYKVCNIVCPEPACSTATVIFLIGSVDDCEIFNVVTPNDDGANDFFFVPCLDYGEVADSEVTIFNQYGDVVYHAKPYDNDNPWRGQYKGSDLPVGTYFYIVKFNSQSEPKKGFLQLQR